MRTDHKAYARPREEWRGAAENYWKMMANPSGWTTEIERARRELAALSVRLHIFEQGRRSKR